MTRFRSGFIVGLLVGAFLTGLGLVGMGTFVKVTRTPIRSSPTIAISDPSQTAKTVETGPWRITFGGPDPAPVLIERGSDKLTFTPLAGERCDSPVTSPNGQTLFLLAHTKLSVTCILQFDTGNTPLADVQPQRILTKVELQSLLDGKDSWVTKLQRVSDSGDRLLLNVLVEDRARGAGAATYYDDQIYWYDLKNHSLNEPTD